MGRGPALPERFRLARRGALVAGLKHYAGQQCTKLGHGNLRYASNDHCLDCVGEYHDKYKAERQAARALRDAAKVHKQAVAALKAPVAIESLPPPARRPTLDELDPPRVIPERFLNIKEEARPRFTPSGFIRTLTEAEKMRGKA